MNETIVVVLIIALAVVSVALLGACVWMSRLIFKAIEQVKVEISTYILRDDLGKKVEQLEEKFDQAGLVLDNRVAGLEKDFEEEQEQFSRLLDRVEDLEKKLRGEYTEDLNLINMQLADAKVEIKKQSKFADKLLVKVEAIEQDIKERVNKITLELDNRLCLLETEDSLNQRIEVLEKRQSAEAYIEKPEVSPQQQQDALRDQS